MTTGISGLQPTATIATQTVEAILADTKATTGTSGALISAMPTDMMKEATHAAIRIPGGSCRLPIVTITDTPRHRARERDQSPHREYNDEALTSIRR